MLQARSAMYTDLKNDLEDCLQDVESIPKDLNDEKEMAQA